MKVGTIMDNNVCNVIITMLWMTEDFVSTVILMVLALLIVLEDIPLPLKLYTMTSKEINLLNNKLLISLMKTMLQLILLTVEDVM